MTDVVPRRCVQNPVSEVGSEKRMFGGKQIVGVDSHSQTRPEMEELYIYQGEFAHGARRIMQEMVTAWWGTGNVVGFGLRNP